MIHVHIYTLFLCMINTYIYIYTHVTYTCVLFADIALKPVGPQMNLPALRQERGIPTMTNLPNSEVCQQQLGSTENGGLKQQKY